MEIGAERRASPFDRTGGVYPVKNQVCKYWLQGRCNRNPCRFMHRESPPSNFKYPNSPAPPKLKHPTSPATPKFKHPNSSVSDDICPKQSKGKTWVNPNYNSPKNATVSTIGGDRLSCTTSRAETDSGLQNQQKTPVSQPTQCKYWVTGNCVHGDKCKDLHSWFSGSEFTMLTKLEGHNKTITGIALPSGSDKLYSGGKDKCIRAWDCNSGQCAGSVCLDGEVGCLISEGPWLFAGFPNTVKAWNIQNRAEFSINGPLGQVHCMVVDNDMIYAGTESGTIFVWKYNLETNIPEQAAVLKGHSGAVCSLIIGRDMLYSGSRDCTIKMWDLQNLQCKQTLHGHTRDVTSVLCWDNYLLSASLDNTLKAWAVTENGSLEVVYEAKEDDGVIALCGIHDSEARPILLCSYTDNTVRLYDLPSFAERARIFSKRQVGVIQIGIDGLFFTGDATGEVSVWKLLGVPKAPSELT
ncbi:hypothetical protein ACJIZ3_016147 [Penstemon smallii]|uniref:C3H1-type domain-containing protein n=1 Tax=Penstemon smallii TaxID=265156 RepID=A0ABD3RPJ4_9LAMI